jgi:hypothetical protein
VNINAPDNLPQQMPPEAQRWVAPAMAGDPGLVTGAPAGGKGFGGGEATRDPAPTSIDQNDPKGKQQAIHKAESFAEYLAKRASS